MFIPLWSELSCPAFTVHWSIQYVTLWQVRTRWWTLPHRLSRGAWGQREWRWESLRVFERRGVPRGWHHAHKRQVQQQQVRPVLTQAYLINMAVHYSKLPVGITLSIAKEKTELQVITCVNNWSQMCLNIRKASAQQHKCNRKRVYATCFYTIKPWLQPDTGR